MVELAPRKTPQPRTHAPQHTAEPGTFPNVKATAQVGECLRTLWAAAADVRALAGPFSQGSHKQEVAS
jgi:hypothetical protein